MTQLIPFALKDTPALIEAAFPSQKVSYESQRERKAGPGQLLTSLGSYWKGRKPLFLVRAILFGTLLPTTSDTEKDLEILEMLLGMDDESLAKRAMSINLIKPADIAEKVIIPQPWKYFSHNIKKDDPHFSDINGISFPCDTNELGIKVRWNKGIDERDKIEILRKFIAQIEKYEDKSNLGKRPEEVEQEWLYSHIWSRVNSHLGKFGISAKSHHELVEQLGILRFGHRPVVGDTFSGGGSIPFEAARVGCDVYASDLNPVACMLTWSALNIIGAEKDMRSQIEEWQHEVSTKVETEISNLGIEHDEFGNRAKAFLYCLEARCPETGWLIPLSPSWVISKSRRVVAKLVPLAAEKRFDIIIESGVTDDEMLKAENGTFFKGNMVYELNGKSFKTPIKTLRGDFKNTDGLNCNRLRKWKKSDFEPAKDDIFQERLYAIHWITKESLSKGKKEYFFTGNTPYIQEIDEKIRRLVKTNLDSWQRDGLIPDMEIESGAKTDEPIRTRGWTHWHHLFTPRQLLMMMILQSAIKESKHPEFSFFKVANTVNWISKLCLWATSPARQTGGAGDYSVHVFYNQALNTHFNFASRSWFDYQPIFEKVAIAESPICSENIDIQTLPAEQVNRNVDVFITDPPYADAVHYHEITEYFIAWLRKTAPVPFDKWNWDSRRALAIKGMGDDFRKGMVKAYKAMTEHMPDNGMQCVMFTHQDTSVWSDMIGIFWASGLQVVGAWYIATETTSELKKGGYVQGTVILMLRKRPVGENQGFKQRLLPAVRAEVKRQIETMMHLNDEVNGKLGEPVFNDSDLQMAGYAAALKVLTSYTHIGGEDVTSFALRPRSKGEVTVVDEIVQQASEAANSLLVPEGLSVDTWQKINGIQRFYLRMMDIETTGASKLDNYQNLAKAFRVEDYGRVMGNMTANKAQLKRISEFASRDLTDSSEIGSTWLGHLIIGLQQILNEKEPQIIISQLQADLPDFVEARPILINMLLFIENKAPEKATRDAAEVLSARLKNIRVLGQ
ncbi:TPA: DUF1156 domain-containing protein [Enterobacter hormaechei]|nr:DUF1156 domain-containing protein [Enterobacter hormaechei]HCT3229366.1 DUF1156 domain-containing protein [Enterobacter hormaechei]